VLDSTTGAELLADRDYGTDVYGFAFAPDGGLIASSFDGHLRRYSPELKLAVKRKAPDGEDSYGVAIDPPGQRVTIGYLVKLPISIVDARTLVPIEGAYEGSRWRQPCERRVVAGRLDARFGHASPLVDLPTDKMPASDSSTAHKRILPRICS
jgi:hypothetical protein